MKKISIHINIYNKIINRNWSFCTLLELLSITISCKCRIIRYSDNSIQLLGSNNWIQEIDISVSRFLIAFCLNKKKKRKWNEFNSAEVGLCSLPFGSRINPSKQSRYNSHPPFATPSVHLLKFRNWLRTIFKYATKRKFNLFLLVILNKIYSKFHFLDFIFLSVM